MKNDDKVLLEARMKLGPSAFDSEDRKGLYKLLAAAARDFPFILEYGRRNGSLFELKKVE